MNESPNKARAFNTATKDRCLLHSARMPHYLQIFKHQVHSTEYTIYSTDGMTFLLTEH